ncbi:MAG: hypothetical protein KC422_03175 [Trueperaceae bacterium]|nr:hypothetical protein [Trueperaceae bacterium]
MRTLRKRLTRLKKLATVVSANDYEASLTKILADTADVPGFVQVSPILLNHCRKCLKKPEG